MEDIQKLRKAEMGMSQTLQKVHNEQSTGIGGIRLASDFKRGTTSNLESGQLSPIADSLNGDNTNTTLVDRYRPKSGKFSPPFVNNRGASQKTIEFLEDLAQKSGGTGTIIGNRDDFDETLVLHLKPTEDKLQTLEESPRVSPLGEREEQSINDNNSFEQMISREDSPIKYDPTGKRGPPILVSSSRGFEEDGERMTPFNMMNKLNAS